MKNKVISTFSEQYGYSAEKVFFAPGRVNLIGEHTDYNGGHVLPCALTLGTYAAVAARDDRELRLYSVNLPDEGVIKTNLDEFAPLAGTGWASYLTGVMWAFAEAGMSMNHGLDIVIGGDIPTGSGLSSSASVEVLTGRILRDLFGFYLTDKQIALLGQTAENRYVGVNCGIMDQFASSMGRRENAIFLNTGTLEYEYVPVRLDGMKLIVTNTNKKHSLADGAYNARRAECAEALKALQRAADIQNLCDLTPEEFEQFQNVIPDDTARKRAKHAVYENARTVEAVRVLTQGDVERFGKLMNESHISLRDDYEVSCRELDTLVAAAWEVPGVLGTRMTGGGFGGCTVSVVRDEAIPIFCETVEAMYQAAIGWKPTFYIVSIGGKE